MTEEMYYHCNETDEIVSLSQIRSEYSEFGAEYQSFDDYLSACMWYNNGALTDVRDKLREVKAELSRKLDLARKYGYDEYSDELANLLADMDRLGKYIRNN